MKNVGIIGAGAWGTALAVAVHKSGQHVLLQAHEEEVVASINTDHVNNIYLPDVELPADLKASAKMSDLASCDILLVVTPAQFLRQTCQTIKTFLKSGTPLLVCAKGIERESGLLMSEVIQEEIPGVCVGVLSGPTFAKEVALNIPSACTLAMDNIDQALEVGEIIGSSHFRIYAGDDIVGSQIGGSVKNVLAIASGMASGKGYGDNTRAALITRGISELTRLGVAKGAKPETLMGLSGMGDLILTCNSMQSRNFSLGFALGEGEKLDDILAKRTAVTEGVYSATSVCELAEKLNVDMPICQAVYRVLNNKADVDEVIEALLSRPFKEEKISK